MNAGSIHFRSVAKRTLALLALAFLVASCRPFSFNYVTPSGPPEYRLGWEDGCDSGISAEGSFIYKAMYGFKKRPEMADNDQYKQAWNEGFTYCRFALAGQKSDNDSFEKLGW